MAESAERTVVVGRISGVFGVRGWLRIFSFTDPPEGILTYSPWLVGDSGAQSFRVVEGAGHGRGVIAHLDGIDDRDVARALVGATIRVPRARFGRTRPGEYYWSDLVGLQVVNDDGAVLGRVVELLATGANDVLVVQGERRRLLPFLPGQVVTSVDLTAAVIRVVWDEDF